ncbi:MAG: tRNA (guanine(10)-N(2))-dimethyltransferase [Nanoarchaeota archaeon]
MPESKVKEGKVRLLLPAETDPADMATRRMPVFYNPIMKENRDVSVAMLRSAFSGGDAVRIGLPLAGSGIRALRFSLELPQEMVAGIWANDMSDTAVAVMKEQVELNRAKKIIVSQQEANCFIRGSKGFDYIDIDPFGSPNPFLDTAVQRLSRRGMLAVTATDTAPLSGTYMKACRRKYDATPLRCAMMHEIGLRILIRKVQLVGMQYDRALLPVLSYSKDHYFRVYLQNVKGKKDCDAVWMQHGVLSYCQRCQWHAGRVPHVSSCPHCGADVEQVGPMWLGRLYYDALIDSLDADCALLESIKEEMSIPVLGFFDIPMIHKRLHTSRNVPFDELMEAISHKGYGVARTHFLATALKTDMPLEELEKIIEKKQG